jgi:2-C-methyl-D-erythritol 2,4-cyclodiphosphate synthase
MASRTGFGIDVHPLVSGRSLVLGGVVVPSELGLMGHSDADVLTHAVCDAMLGALALGDLGQHFPDTDEQYRGVSSLVLLREVSRRVEAAGGVLINVDATVLAQVPRLSPFLAAMGARLAETLGVDPSQVSVKAKSPEALGLVGRGEGIVAMAVACVEVSSA